MGVSMLFMSSTIDILHHGLFVSPQIHVESENQSHEQIRPFIGGLYPSCTVIKIENKQMIYRYKKGCGHIANTCSFYYHNENTRLVSCVHGIDQACTEREYPENVALIAYGLY